MRASNWSRIIAGLAIAAPIPYVAYAEVYLTESQAASVLFPGILLKASWVELTPQEVKRIEKSSGGRVLSPRVRIWTGPDGQTVMIDRVLGKHEFINYAVAITPEGKVQGIEILDYQETYGYQIREQKWRAQFVGKSVQDPLKLDKDIVNISGATLSCAHITNGVRRVLRTYEILKSKT